MAGKSPKKKGAAKAPPRKLPGRKRKSAAKLAPSSSSSSWPIMGDRVSAPGADAAVLDRVWGVVTARRHADPALSHSARLLARGTEKVAQKFGEEAVECLIEAVAGRREALIAESADVLYHLLVMWVDAEVRPEEVWAELARREGISGVAEKASRGAEPTLACGTGTRKIP